MIHFILLSVITTEYSTEIKTPQYINIDRISQIIPLENSAEGEPRTHVLLTTGKYLLVDETAEAIARKLNS